MSSVITIQRQQTAIDDSLIAAALARLSYGWMDRSADPVATAMVGVDGMPLRTQVQQFYSHMRGVRPYRGLGSRSFIPTYTFTSNGEVFGSAYRSREQFLLTQHRQDVQMATFRSLFGEADDEDGYAYIQGRNPLTALYPAMRDSNFSAVTTARTEGRIKVVTPFVRDVSTFLQPITAPSSAETYTTDATKLTADDLSSVPILFSSKAIGDISSRHAHAERQMSKMAPRISKDDIITFLSKNGARNGKFIILHISGGVMIGTTANLVGKFKMSKMHSLSIEDGEEKRFTGEYDVVVSVRVEGTREQIMSELAKGKEKKPQAIHLKISRINKIITVIQKNCPTPKLLPSGMPWFPASALTPDHSDVSKIGSIAICDEDGQRKVTSLSLEAMQTDPWTQLPLTLKDNPAIVSLAETQRARENPTTRNLVPITRQGFEIEDVDAFIESLSESKLNVLKRNLFGRIISVFCGMDQKSITPKRLEDLYDATIKYIDSEASLAVTHSGQVRTTSQVTGGVPVTSEQILQRLILSRLMTTGIPLKSYGNVESLAFHMWSYEDLESLRIPLCVTHHGIYVYSVDDAFARLLDTDGAWMPKENVYLGQPGVRVIGKIFAPLLSVTVNSPPRSHVMIHPDGTAFSCDTIIQEMELLIRDKGSGRAVVWHPAFCIIMEKAKQDIQGLRRAEEVTAHVIPSPRASRIVKPIKNTEEILRTVMEEPEVKMHEAQVYTSMGYASALIDYLKLAR